MSSLHAKLAWSALRGESLWARFVKYKYVSLHGFQLPLTASHAWHAVMLQISNVEHHSRWLVRSGNKSFWCDNWCGSVLMGPSLVDSQLTVRAGLGIIEQLLPLVPSQFHDAARGVCCREGVLDRLVCTLTTSGEFSWAKYWDLIHVHWPKVA